MRHCRRCRLGAAAPPSPRVSVPFFGYLWAPSKRSGPRLWKQFVAKSGNRVQSTGLPMIFVRNRRWVDRTRSQQTMGVKLQGLFRQQAPAGLNKDLSTCDDVGIAGVFAPMMADAVDRGHKQHAGRHDRPENLRAMTAAAGHAASPAAGNGGAGGFECLLEGSMP